MSGNSGSAAPPPFRHPFFALAVLVALGVAWGVLHNRLDRQDRNDPVLSVTRTILRPFQQGSAAVGNGISSNISWITRGRQLAAENMRLTAENTRLLQENESLRKDAGETARLRAALHLTQTSKKPPLFAPVVSLLPSPRFDTIVVGRGSRDGVREQMVARTAAGLIGQVTSVGPTTCVVTLLTDRVSGVGVLVRRGNKLQGTGILQGNGRDGALEVQYLKREDDIKTGDQVFSSGYGGVVPPDIPIGTVTDVRHEDARFLKTATITPFVPLPGELRAVLILR